MVVGEDGREGLEETPRAGFLLIRLQQVDAGGSGQAEAPFAFFGRTHQTGDGIAGFQVETPNLGLPHENIAIYGRVLHRPQQAVPGIHHLQYSRGGQHVAVGRRQADFLEQRIPTQFGKGGLVPEPHFGGQVQQLVVGHGGQVGHIHQSFGDGAVGAIGITTGVYGFILPGFAGVGDDIAVVGSAGPAVAAVGGEQS